MGELAFINRRNLLCLLFAKREKVCKLSVGSWQFWRGTFKRVLREIALWLFVWIQVQPKRRQRILWMRGSEPAFAAARSRFHSGETAPLHPRTATVRVCCRILRWIWTLWTWMLVFIVNIGVLRSGTFQFVTLFWLHLYVPSSNAACPDLYHSPVARQPTTRLGVLSSAREGKSVLSRYRFFRRCSSQKIDLHSKVKWYAIRLLRRRYICSFCCFALFLLAKGIVYNSLSLWFRSWTVAAGYPRFNNMNAWCLINSEKQ